MGSALRLSRCAALRFIPQSDVHYVLGTFCVNTCGDPNFRLSIWPRIVESHHHPPPTSRRSHVLSFHFFYFLFLFPLFMGTVALSRPEEEEGYCFVKVKHLLRPTKRLLRIINGSSLGLTRERALLRAAQQQLKQPT